MYNSYRRERSFGTTMLIILGANALFQGGLLLGKLSADAGDRVREAQEHNAELQSQLMQEYPTMDEFVITDDNDKTFTFRMQEAGVAQECHGEYDIKSDVAVAVGSIACTQTHKVS